MNGGIKARTKPTNVSLDALLVKEAKELGVSISQASNRGLEQAVKKARAERWLEQNKGALHSSNEWMESNGLPLEKYRLF
ncbi:MAG TPA: type II toxin-antitoxin system CcdA family antitoxin [Sphingomicrobium sp.]|jgi:antitoxin CcdA|nr:type II toxin-antitoxin system CcdA family antitoxin [Sphingomicrobium sp.]